MPIAHVLTMLGTFLGPLPETVEVTTPDLLRTVATTSSPWLDNSIEIVPRPFRPFWVCGA
eukprot:954953-Karenia_brevis.AAC.1